jgi:hypothetical protein
MATTLTINRTVGDTLTPLVVFLTDSNSDPVSLAGKTVKFYLENSVGTLVVNGNSSHVTAEPTQTFTVDITNDRILCVGHGYKAGQQVQVTTAGSLPGGLASATRYYVGDVTPNDFTLQSRPGAAPSDFRLDAQDGDVVDITTTGSGTHSIFAVGQAQYDFQAADVATAGTFTACFKVDSGGETDTYPGGDVTLQIVLRTRP